MQQTQASIEHERKIAEKDCLIDELGQKALSHIDKKVQVEGTCSDLERRLADKDAQVSQLEKEVADLVDIRTQIETKDLRIHQLEAEVRIRWACVGQGLKVNYHTEDQAGGCLEFCYDPEPELAARGQCAMT